MKIMVPTSPETSSELRCQAGNESEPVRCIVCDWPYSKRRGDGCVPGDCSYRPGRGEPRINARRELIARVKAELISLGWQPPNRALAVASNVEPAAALSHTGTKPLHPPSPDNLSDIGRLSPANRDTQPRYDHADDALSLIEAQKTTEKDGE